MEKFISYYGKATTVVAWLVLAFAALLIGAIVASIFVEALARYLFDSSQAFMEELPRQAIAFIVFPMMGALLKTGKHLSVDLLPIKLKGRQHTKLLIIVYAIVLVVAMQFFLSGISTVLFYKAMGQVTQTEIVIPLWWVYSAFPIGFGLLIFFDFELLLKETWMLHKQRLKAMGSQGKRL